MAERFINLKQVLDRTSLSKTEVYNRMRAGTFPRSYALGPHKVAWLEAAVAAWIDATIAAVDVGAPTRKAKSQKAVTARARALT